MRDWLGRPPTAGLPSYFGDPEPPRASVNIGAALAGVSHRALEGMGRPRPVPAGSVHSPSALDRSPVFSRMIELPTERLAGAITRMFPRSGSEVRFGALRVSRPEPTRRGDWEMHGRWRALHGLRTIPVRIEVWPVHDCFCRISLTPGRNVVTSRHYFGKGHRYVDQLCEEMRAEVTRAVP